MSHHHTREESDHADRSTASRWARCLAKHGLLLGPVVGLGCLAWFLLRVVPKPARAGYPCQRIAFPLASSFVLWLTGLAGSLAGFLQLRRLARKPVRTLTVAAVLLGLLAGGLMIMSMPEDRLVAGYPEGEAVNAPLGKGFGVHPGRVVMVHDADATSWDGVSDSQSNGELRGYWGRANSIGGDVVESWTDPAVVAQMLSNGLRWLTEEQTDADAWNALLTDFNLRHGKGAVGYQPGEKIIIKINLTTTYGTGTVYSDWRQKRNRKYTANSLELIAALLTQLIDVVGVAPQDITMGDTTCIFPLHLRNYLVNYDSRFANIHMQAEQTTDPPSWSEYDHYTSTAHHWSYPGANPSTNWLPYSYYNADYFINFPVLKTHQRAGITALAKNMFGSQIRHPATGGCFDLHTSLPLNMYGGIPGYDQPGSYRCLVDIMGQPHWGGKTLLNLVDGLWAGYDWAMASQPIKWHQAPFNNDWPSMLLLSQDAVAAESVSYDLLYAESLAQPATFPYPEWVQGDAVDDYLHEAALADNPPSGTFYDPDGDGVALTSLGIHEHWNNHTDKKYTRNLGTGYGIELITAEPNPPVARKVFYNNSRFDGQNPAANAADDAAIAPDKEVLLPGDTATFANYTSYAKGINGIMVDIDSLPGTPTAADFTFRTGNDDDPTGWSTVAATPTITVRPGAGEGGSDRVTITFPDGAISKCWLEVTVKASGNTGLNNPDVFYVGNAIGETGDSSAHAMVNATDEVGVRNNPHNLAYSPAGITDVYDFDRDQRVGPTDALLARNNGTSQGAGTALNLITAP